MDMEIQKAQDGKMFRLELKALGDKLYERSTNTKNLFWI